MKFNIYAKILLTHQISAFSEDDQVEFTEGVIFCISYETLVISIIGRPTSIDYFRSHSLTSNISRRWNKDHLIPMYMRLASIRDIPNRVRFLLLAY